LLRDGSLAFDGPVHEAITRYRRSLADDGADGDAAAGAAAPRAGLATLRLVAADGEPRERFLAGEPFALEVELAGPVEAAALQLEIRDGSGLLVAEEIIDPRSLGNGDQAGATLRFDVPSPPLEFGRFEVALSLLGADGRLLDRLSDRVPLLVYPGGEGRGLVRLEGTWRRGAKDDGP
jgi:hypothetical protein